MQPISSLSKISLVTLTAMALSACSVMQESKIDYKSASKGSTLEVPPDLTQLSHQTHYNIPSELASASALLAGEIQQTESAGRVARDEVADVKLQRSGDTRWLSVPRSSDVLWDPIRQFWLNNGFTLAMDQLDIGVMETDWAENRAKLPQDFIRNTLGSVLGSLYSTGERDRFRTRLERRPDDGGTDIYITHRGMVEELTGSSKESTVWQPRKADHELETEFLRRLMVALGLSEEQSRAVVAQSAAQDAKTDGSNISPNNVKIVDLQGQQALEVNDAFDQAWRRVGTALDRTSFTVEDRDRAQGIYFVRYVSPTEGREKTGFFGRLFGSSKTGAPPVKYRVKLQNSGENTYVIVQNEAGQAVQNQEEQTILKLLHDDMK